ncbi:MAG: hypothetical protein JWP95_1306 [Actinotalea sp.]|jgi:hypothetical protein|nr:hypothetical protein [Actinotalea sp.]
MRLHRPGWRDPRLLLGVVLVAGSVALGSGLVSAAGRTTPVYVAHGPLVAGEVLELDRLTVEEVRLTGSGDSYLRADEALPDGLVVVRTVGDAELVPLSALGRADDLAVRPVAITPTGDLPTAVTEGSAVDLWYVPEPGGGAGSTVTGSEASSLAPTQLAAGFTVAEVSEPDGAFAVGSAVTVHVLVPVGELAAVLEALAAPGSVEVVHVPGGVPAP